MKKVTVLLERGRFSVLLYDFHLNQPVEMAAGVQTLGEAADIAWLVADEEGIPNAAVFYIDGVQTLRLGDIL